jgi:hypothetical protein
METHAHPHSRLVRRGSSFFCLQDMKYFIVINNFCTTKHEDERIRRLAIHLRVRNGFFTFSFSFSLAFAGGLLKIRVRKLYLDLGVTIFCTIEGAGVLTMVVGARCVGVDEPKATEVVFTCTTRLIRAELDRAETINQLIRRSRLSHSDILLGVTRKKDWIRLKVDGFGVTLAFSAGFGVCMMIG